MCFNLVLFEGVMGKEQHKKQQRQVLIAYFMMFLTVLAIVPMIIAYTIAMRLSYAPEMEVWLNSHVLWIMRSIMIFFCIAIFAALWFIPLIFVTWDQYIWVTACSVIGVVFALISWIYLLNSWIKGIIRFFKRKPVY